MTTQNNIFEPTLKIRQKTSVSNVNVSNDFCFFVVSLIPVCVKIRQESSTWKGLTHLRHIERSFRLLLCVMVYKVIRWSHCELRRS